MLSTFKGPILGQRYLLVNFLEIQYQERQVIPYRLTIES